MNPLPPVTKLSPRVWRMMGLNPGAMTLQGSNTYLVGVGSERLLIDSGEGKQEYQDVLTKTLEMASRETGNKVSITQLLLTHWHPDHVGGVATVLRLFPDVELLKKPSKYHHVAVDSSAKNPPDCISVEGATMKILSTPGHTDDHLCVYLEEEEALFTSDTILGEGTSTFSCYNDYMSTLNLLKSYEPKKLYPAHGPVVEDGVKKIEEIIAHRRKREDQIIDILTKNSPREVNILELVRVMYADTPMQLWVAAGLNVFHHLKKLIHEGKVSVVSLPETEIDILSDASDYSIMGEGVKTDKDIVDRIFSDLKVKLL